MSDYHPKETDPDTQFHESQVSYEQNPERVRPMTTAEYPGAGPRQKLYGNQNYKSPQNANSKHIIRAVSAKPQKNVTTILSPKSRMTNANANYGGGGGKNKNFIIQTTRLIHSPSNEMSRTTPKNIPQDKERLYEETIHLKQYVNALREENLKYKTRISNLEKEASKFEKMIQENNQTQYRDTPPPKGTDNYFAITLKQNVKELRIDLKKKEDELAEIKKTIKFTKIQEIESQLKAFQDEATRLRTLMEHVMKEKTQIVMTEEDKNRVQQEYFVQVAQLQSLKRDNEEMATAIKILEEQNFEYEKKISEQDKKFQREQNKHKKALQEKEKEILKLKNDPNAGMTLGSNLAKRPMTTGAREDPFRQELDKKIQENNNLINQLAEKRNQVLTLERQLREAKAESNEKITNLQNDKQALLRELDKQKNAKASSTDLENKRLGHEGKANELKLDDYVKRASLQANFLADERENSPGYNSAGRDEKKKHSQFGKKRVQKVRPEDVKNIGYVLNLRLRLKRLSFEDVDKLVWPERLRKNNLITIKDLIRILKESPFSVNSEDDVLLTARYLVEDNEHEYLFYDENAKNDLTIVRSILKKLIGSIPVWNKRKLQQVHEEVVDLCVTNLGGLKENLKVLCKTGFLTTKALKEACNIIEVQITDEQIEYIVMKLFERSGDLLKLSIEDLFDVFSEKNRRIHIEDDPSEAEEYEKSATLKSKENLPIRETHREEDEEDEEEEEKQENYEQENEEENGDAEEENFENGQENENYDEYQKKGSREGEASAEYQDEHEAHGSKDNLKNSHESADKLGKVTHSDNDEAE